MKTVFGKITAASLIETANGKTSIMLDVVNPRTLGASKEFIAPRVVAHAFAKDADAEVVEDEKVLKVGDKVLEGNYLSASCHEIGDLLHDGTEATTDSLINNSTVTFLNVTQVRELMSL